MGWLYWRFAAMTVENRGNIHVQYTQTDTNRQNTLTNRTIGKRLRFVKEVLRFVPLERMVNSSVDRYTICKLHLITLVSRAKTNGRLVPLLVQVEE